MSDEPVYLMQYDPTWPRRFEEERALLAGVERIVERVLRREPGADVAI